MNDWTNGVSTLYRADAREIPLPDASVHCVVTSPPYWGLRDYGLGRWQGGDAECVHARPEDAWPNANGGKLYPNNDLPWPNGVCGLCGAVNTPGGIGLEPTLGEWVENVVEVMREVRRVLRDDGTVWLNLGDAYAGSGKGNSRNGRKDGGKQNTNKGSLGLPRDHSDLSPKNLMGQPWRVAFALQDDEWILRSAIVWHKPNPMPESTKDRPTSAYEMVFLLAKQARYFYDAEAVREPHSMASLARYEYGLKSKAPDDGLISAGSKGGIFTSARMGDHVSKAGANARNVWRIPTQGRPDAHFATFPDELPRRCILAGTSEHGVCGECGAPWARVVEKGETVGEYPRNPINPSLGYARKERAGETPTQTRGWQPTCDCDADVVPAIVLDPFVGSGTTVAVAQAIGRRGVGVDLNSEYLKIAANRIGAVPLPLIAYKEY